MDQHYSSEDFKVFANGQMVRNEARALVAHFLRGCPICQAESAILWEAREPVPEDAYDAVLDRVIATVRAGRRGAGSFDGLNPLQETAGVAATVEGPELVEALLQRAWGLRHDEPAEMLRTARLAVLAANCLSPSLYGAAEIAEARCRASAGYGNACRVAGNLDEAEQELERAAGLLAQGTGDPVTRARLFEFQASLESARGNHGLALTALDAAHAIHVEQGDRHMAGRALIAKGLYTGHAGRSREARRLTQQGLEMVDEDKEPALVLSAIHNQLWFLVEGGRPREARSLLGAHRARLEAGEIQRLDLLWLDGRISAGLRNETAALEDLEAAERGFTVTGRLSRAASVKLDLASVHLTLGDPARALALVRSAEEALSQAGTAKNILMALSFLRRTLANREVSSQFVLRLANVVRRGQREA